MEGINLSLSSLAENQDPQSLDLVLNEGSSLGQDLDEDIIVGADPAAAEEEQEEETSTGDFHQAYKPQQNNTNEPIQAESVVGEEDKNKTSEENTTQVNVGNSSPDSKMSQIYSSLATHFRDSGVLSSLNLEETPINSIEDLQAALEKEISSKLTDKQKEYEELRTKGVPTEKYLQYQAQLDNLETITPEAIASDDDKAVKLRFNIIAQNFLNRGFEQEEAMKYARTSVDLGEDKQDAAKALQDIKTHIKTKFDTEIANLAAEEQKVNTNIKEFIDNKSELVKGIKITAPTKEKLFKQMTTATSRDENGNPLSEYGRALKEDPVKMQVLTEYLFMVTKGFSDFSKFTNTIESKKTREIDEILKNNGSALLQGGAVNLNNSDANSSFLSDDFKLDI